MDGRAKIIRTMFLKWPLKKVILLLVPAIAAVLSTGCHDNKSNLLRIGLASEPKTLNVWLASDASSRAVLRLIYHPLYVRDPKTLDFVPWLAESRPLYDPAGKTYTIGLRQARWSDGHPLTSADVAFTVKLIKEFKTPGWSRWKYVSKVETPDQRTVVFHLKKNFATFLSRTLQIVILPAHKWRAVARAARRTQKPLATLMRYKNENPLSSGPFVMKQWRKGAYIHLAPNPYFFGRHKIIAGHRMGPLIKGVLFKFYGTTDVAMLALRKGELDMYWQHIQPGYMDILENTPHVKIINSPKSALYFMGFNTRRPPFDDVALRRAVEVLVDKHFIVERLLQGQGSEMWSIIPEGNRRWYNPHLPRPGEGLNREQRIRKAYQILSAAGYRWQKPPLDADGKIIARPGDLLTPGGDPLKPFTILTPPADYDPARAISGTMIQEWLREIGMPAKARPMEFGALIQQVKVRRNFDAFILGYGRLPLDPDYMRSLFHSRNDRPRGWNMSGYHNPEFDRLATAAQREMNPRKRRKLVFAMQSIIAADVPYLPLYLPTLNQAVRTDRFSGWVSMLDGIGNRWSFCLLREVEGAP